MARKKTKRASNRGQKAREVLKARREAKLALLENESIKNENDSVEKQQHNNDVEYNNDVIESIEETNEANNNDDDNHNINNEENEHFNLDTDDYDNDTEVIKVIEIIDDTQNGVDEQNYSEDGYEKDYALMEIEDDSIIEQSNLNIDENAQTGSAVILIEESQSQGSIQSSLDNDRSHLRLELSNLSANQIYDNEEEEQSIDEKTEIISIIEDEQSLCILEEEQNIEDDKNTDESINKVISKSIVCIVEDDSNCQDVISVESDTKDNLTDDIKDENSSSAKESVEIDTLEDKEINVKAIDDEISNTRLDNNETLIEQIENKIESLIEVKNDIKEIVTGNFSAINSDKLEINSIIPEMTKQISDIKIEQKHNINISLPFSTASTSPPPQTSLTNNIYAEAYAGLSNEVKSHIFEALMRTKTSENVSTIQTKPSILTQTTEVELPTAVERVRIKIPPPQNRNNESLDSNSCIKINKDDNSSLKMEIKTEEFKNLNNKIKTENNEEIKLKNLNKKLLKKHKKKLKLDKKEKKTINDDETSIRRSTRIKTISQTRQKSHGRGLVKDKERFIVTHENINSEQFNDNQNTFNNDSIKPEKLKSRWRESCEQEMTTLTPSSSSPLSIKKNDVIEKVDIIHLTKEDEEKYLKNQKEIELRLSQFLKIKDNIYHCDKNISKEAKKMTCDCFLTKEEIERGELGCGEDCLNRLLMIECGSRCIVGDRCTNRRFQKVQYSLCEIVNTEKKGFGIKAVTNIPPGEFIMEYVGEVLNSEQFEKRANEYSKDKNKHYYFMALRSDAVIDATAKGNISRFINHSCNPNAETQKWTVNGELRIGFFSTRTIMRGEEITFDYQFQRYGKEAQKCYCEADNCRGWIGEEPDSGCDDDEGDYDEEEDGEEEEEAQEKNDIVNNNVLNDSKLDISIQSSDGSVKDIIVVKSKRGRKPKNNIIKKPKRPEIFDDADLDDEIINLNRTGLKNQAHTLKLSRLMVRAKLMDARSRLLNLLLNGEIPCRRLFLDYHGLKLLYGWISDSLQTDKIENLQFRLEILETLKELPITNMTTLKDSKIYHTIEKWCTDAELKNNCTLQLTNEDSPSDSGSGTPLQTDDINNSNLNLGTTTTAPINSSNKLVIIKSDVAASGNTIEINNKNSNNLLEDNNDINVKLSPTTTTETANKSTVTLTELQNEEQIIINIKKKIIILSIELIKSWKNLPEIFRIPKKERIEQMKEHEREADLTYKALGLIDDEPDNFQYTNRYRDRNREKDRDNETIINSKDIKKESGGIITNNYWEKPKPFKTIDKFQRRHLFEMKFARQQEEKRKLEYWRLHESKCRCFGLDPRIVRPPDIPTYVNPATGQWYTYDNRPVATPPSHAHIKPPEPEMSTNPDDYILPPMDLPPLWEFAIDTRGRIYYYHTKIRISQWAPPIYLPSLTDDTNKIKTEEESDHSGSDKEDSTTTDTCDSSEEELIEQVRILTQKIQKRKKKLNATEIPTKVNIADEIKDSILKEVNDDVQSDVLDNSLNDTLSINPPPGSNSPLKLAKRKSSERRKGLCQHRIISPRREEDRIYGQLQSKLYRETKEKLRKRKEEVKKRKLLENSDSSSMKKITKLTEGLPIITSANESPESDDEKIATSSSLTTIAVNNNLLVTPTSIIDGDNAVDIVESLITNKMEDDNRLLDNLDLEVVARENTTKKHLILDELKLKPQHKHNKHDKKRDNSKLLLTDDTEKDSPKLPKKRRINNDNKESSHHVNSEEARRIKEKFRGDIAGVIVQHLGPYRKETCTIGRIETNEDFKHLARKLTHFVMLKELKHRDNTVNILEVTDSVKIKAREFIKKYMAKYGTIYQRGENEPDFKD